MIKKSLLGKLFGALVFLVKGIVGIIVFLVKLVFSAVSSLTHLVVKHASKPRTSHYFTAIKPVEVRSGSPSSLEDFLYANKSTVGIIIGARGSGKSALGMRVLENAAAKGRKVCAMGFREETLPHWIKCVNEPDAPNGSFLLVDEGGITFNSRESLSDANKLLSKLLLVARHKDLSVLFISQNSANVDVNALRQADYLLLKKPSLLQAGFERKEISEIYEKARDGFKKYAELKGVFYAYSDAFTGFAESVLPSFWTEKTSKAYAGKKLV